MNSPFDDVFEEVFNLTLDGTATIVHARTRRAPRAHPVLQFCKDQKNRGLR